MRKATLGDLLDNQWVGLNSDIPKLLEFSVGDLYHICYEECVIRKYDFNNIIMGLYNLIRVMLFNKYGFIIDETNILTQKLYNTIQLYLEEIVLLNFKDNITIHSDMGFTNIACLEDRLQNFIEVNNILNSVEIDLNDYEDELNNILNNFFVDEFIVKNRDDLSIIELVMIGKWLKSNFQDTNSSIAVCLLLKGVYHAPEVCE